MLTSDQLDTLVDPIVGLYSDYSDSIIIDIARRLKAMGNVVTEASAWQAQRLIESGKVYDKAIQEISRLTGISQRRLREMFEKAGVKAIKFDDKVYEAAGLKPLPLNLSPQMARVLAAGLQKTNFIANNLTLTTARSAQAAFIKAADLAYVQVTTGGMSYDQAIRAAIKDAAGQGLSVIDYRSGHVDQLDVAMRRTVLTGVSQTTGKLQEARAEEMGSDLVQVSAHIGARPSHQVWQGKVFSRSGKSKKYPDFVSSTDYGTVTGLMGANCRHSFFPFFEGLSEEAYKGAELETFKRKKVQTTSGRKTVYDALQLQRAIERKIRAWKRQVAALDAAGLDTGAETAKVRLWQARMRELISKTNFTREYSREQV